MNEDEAKRLLEDVRAQSDEAKVLTRIAEERRREAVLVAVEAGLTKSEIARQLGLTPTRVNQIIDNAR